MALALNDRDLLPEGVYDASLKEVEELFGRFQRSDRRTKLFKKLREYVKVLQKSECGSGLISMAVL